MYFLLFYDYVDNIIEKRVPYREGHLNLTEKYVNRGELILGGAFSNPADGAVIIFKVDDKVKIEEFVNQDPYFVNGLVTKWQIREWTVVVGSAL
ncbi:YciI-like protein [Arcobacter sp.]|uniref:YciI-like protein n=1 Tax=Arcobacter sp. TaxID=1872629 RepID=UPI003D0EAA7E